MGANDLANLDATLLVLSHVLGDLAGADDVAVAELDDVAFVAFGVLVVVVVVVVAVVMITLAVWSTLL